MEELVAVMKIIGYVFIGYILGRLVAELWP